MSTHVYHVEQALLKNERFMGSLFISAIADIRAGKTDQGISKMRICYGQRAKDRVKEAIDRIKTLKENLRSALENNSRLQAILANREDVFWENKQLKNHIRELNRKIATIEREATASLADVDWFGGESCP
jgi:hypothetical protein